MKTYFAPLNFTLLKVNIVTIINDYIRLLSEFLFFKKMIMTHYTFYFFFIELYKITKLISNLQPRTSLNVYLHITIFLHDNKNENF